MKLKVCKNCNIYTLQETCPKCGEKTSDAHYKFIKIRDAPKSNPTKIRKKLNKKTSN